jgi:hypothetical protein
MTLADAIKKGAMQRAQCRGWWFEFLSPMELAGPRSCVMGAAYEGAFGPPPMRGAVAVITTLRDELEAAFPELRERATCPVCEMSSRALGSLLIHLNDEEKWTREAIADWLDLRAAAQARA